MNGIIVLWIVGLSFIGFGLFALLDPIRLASIIQYDLTTAVASTELRAFYGGLEIGFGLFLITGARKPEFRHACLLASALVLGFLALARSFGLAIDDSASRLHFIALGSEIIGALLSVWAMRGSHAQK